MMDKEYIICSAIWYNDGQQHDGQPRNIDIGFVIAGRRHYNCYATAKALAGIDNTIKLKVENIENTMSREEYKKHQGFITSKDRYVDRREAYLIAKDVGQIRNGNYLGTIEEPMLISEHIY